MISFCFASRKF